MMTIKDRISEHIKNLDKLDKHYIKLCIKVLNEYGTRTTGAGGPKYEKEGFGTGTRDLRTEIDKRINKIRDTRKFLYAIENFDLPLHKKILRNTLPILAITASWLLSFGLTAIFLFTIAIAMTLMTTFPGWCTAMVAIPSLLFLSLCTFGINHELTDYFTSKQIIPIWRNNS